MRNIRHNIWALYRFLVFTGTIVFVFILWQQYQDVSEAHNDEQYNSIQLFANGTSSLLDNQEMLLNMVAERLMNSPHLSDEEHRQWLKSLLTLNPNIAGFGLVSPTGKAMITSANLMQGRQPNLLEKAETQTTFLRTLNSHKMVVGRSYFKPDLHEAILPIRKAIRNENDRVIAVMTAGLKLDGSRLFNAELHAHEEHQIGLLRSDYYFQYIAGDSDPGLYKTPEPAQMVEALFQQIAESNELTIEQLKAQNTPVTATVKYGDDYICYTILYLPRYDLWAISEIKLAHIFKEYLGNTWGYIAVYICLQLLLYFFIRSIHRYEHHRRDELLYQAHHDPLTALPNRHYLSARAYRWFSDQSQNCGLLYIDMDHYKRVNDSAGHELGDKVLRQIARRLENLQNQEMTLFRASGDEFLFLVKNADYDELNDLAQRIITNLSEPYVIEQFSFILSCSIGISRFPDQGTNLDDLLRAADIAMYQAKQKRNSFCFFTPAMQQSYLDEIRLEQRLRKAVAEKQLFMVYQPQFDNRGKLHGVEALVRWQDDELGFVSPDIFIPVAESCGLMPALGDLVLEKALSEMHQLQHQLGITFQTAVNISVRQITQPDFLNKLLVSIQTAHYNQKYLTLEITENLFIEDIELVRPLFQDLAKLGIRISLDDFGTGYSSLSMLGELPFDEIKIDKSFIDKILTDETASRMAQNIIAIAKNFDREVLAEGVECAEHEKLLQEFGCDLYQGYFYAKPMPAESLMTMLESHNRKTPRPETTQAVLT